MNKHAATILGAAALLLPVAIGSAGSAQAAQTYVMPSVKKMTLQEADDAIAQLSPTTKFVVNSHNIDGYTQKQLNPPLWEVCSQSPSAGSKITASTDIEISVSRFFDGCS